MSDWKKDAYIKNTLEEEEEHLREHGMTRYEQCWDALHSAMTKQSQTIHGWNWPDEVLQRMENIENEVCGGATEPDEDVWDLKVKPNGNYSYAGTYPVMRVSGDKIYNATYATNMPHWKELGLVLIDGAENENDNRDIGFLLMAEDYTIITEEE